VPLGSLSLVIRRLDSVHFHERPQPLLVLEQFLARPCRFLAAALLPLRQLLTHRFAHRLHGLLELEPRQFALL
jgi:hypothetical protein